MSRCPTSFAWFLGVLGIVVGGLGASAVAKDQLTSLEIVGDDGVARIVLTGKGRDGQPQIALYDEKHVQRASIGFARGGPEIALSDRSGKDLISVSVFELEGELIPCIQTTSPAGRWAAIRADANDAGVVMSAGGTKAGSAVMRASKDGAAIEIGMGHGYLTEAFGTGHGHVTTRAVEPDTFAAMFWERGRGGEVEVRTTEGRVADRLPARGAPPATTPEPERK